MAEFLGLEYEGIPHGPAPGAINGHNPELMLGHVRDLSNSLAGIITIGSIGTRFNQGNGGATYDHNPLTGETVNAMGLPEIGMDAAEPLITEASKICADMGKILVVSVTTLAGESAPEVLPSLVERAFNAGAPVVEVNYSCPNIVTAGGGRKPLLGFEPENMVETRGRIADRVGYDRRIIEKLPPYLGENSGLIPTVARAYHVGRNGVAAVAGFNTEPGIELMKDGKPVLRIEAEVNGEVIVTHAGGRSGPAMANVMFEMQGELGSLLPEEISFVAANGVNNGAEVYRRVHTGPRPAIAALSVTAYMEGLKVGRTYGRTASIIAQGYYDALIDNS